MIRLIIFLCGLGAFLIGASSNFETIRQRIHLPFDARAIECGIGTVVMTLDVVLMVVGVFLMIIAWIFKKLNQ